MPRLRNERSIIAQPCPLGNQIGDRHGATMNKHQFSRRTFLRGVGVTMALPWLESRQVWGDLASGAGRASEAPVRLAVLFAGNGFHTQQWWAKGEGAEMELG